MEEPAGKTKAAARIVEPFMCCSTLNASSLGDMLICSVVTCTAYLLSNTIGGLPLSSVTVRYVLSLRH